MASKRKTSGKTAKRSARGTVPRLHKQRGKASNVAALVHSSKRDQTAGKSGVSRSNKRPSDPVAADDGAARDFPDAVYEDDKRS